MFIYKERRIQNHAMMIEYSELQSSRILEPRHKMFFKIGHWWKERNDIEQESTDKSLKTDNIL